jgi:hypothetical protein
MKYYNLFLIVKKKKYIIKKHFFFNKEKKNIILKYLLNINLIDYNIQKIKTTNKLKNNIII